MLGGHLFDEHVLALERFMERLRRRAAFIGIDEDALALPVAGGLDHHAAMPFNKGSDASGEVAVG